MGRKGVEKMSRELYMWLRLRTEGEAKLVVGSLEEEDGIMAWGRLHAKYSQKTMSRLMRLQQECMYPNVAEVGELVDTGAAVGRKVEEDGKGAAEGKRWKRSKYSRAVEDGGDVKIVPEGNPGDG